MPGLEAGESEPEQCGLKLTTDDWVSLPDGDRAQQIRLEGGDFSEPRSFQQRAIAQFHTIRR